MSGLLRRLRASSDANPRAGDAVPEPDASAPAVDEAAPAETADAPAAEPAAEATDAPQAEPATEATDTPQAEPATETAEIAEAAPATATLTSGDPLAQRTVTSGDPLAAPAPAGDATQVMPAAAPVVESPASEAPVLPAGTEAAGPRPDTRRRGRLRRRLRHVRHVRELMLRDVGGLAYEIYRADDPAATEHGRLLVQGKLEALRVLDTERHELETALGDARDTTVLREPGVGGTCPTCGEYFASDARFCSRCGTRVDGRSDPKAPTLGATPEPEADVPVQDGLWAGGQPAAVAAAETPAAETPVPEPMSPAEDAGSGVEPGGAGGPAELADPEEAPAPDEAAPEPAAPPETPPTEARP